MPSRSPGQRDLLRLAVDHRLSSSLSAARRLRPTAGEGHLSAAPDAERWWPPGYPRGGGRGGQGEDRVALRRLRRARRRRDERLLGPGCPLPQPCLRRPARGRCRRDVAGARRPRHRSGDRTGRARRRGGRWVGRAGSPATPSPPPARERYPGPHPLLPEGLIADQSTSSTTAPGPGRRSSRAAISSHCCFRYAEERGRRRSSRSPRSSARRTPRVAEW
jgi:hypothetical protein